MVHDFLTYWRGTFVQDTTLDSSRCGQNVWTSSENHLESHTSFVKLFFSYISFAISVTLKANEAKQEKHVHDRSQSTENNFSKNILDRKAPWDNVLKIPFTPNLSRDGMTQNNITETITKNFGSSQWDAWNSIP